MKTKFFVSALLIVSCQFFISCSSSKHSRKSSDKLPGTWQAKPIIVDGKNDDWTLPYPDYDKKAMIGYAVSNDKDNLYVTVETGDPYTQLKILKEGLTVWIDKKGEREMTTSINYPLSPDENEGGNSQGERPASQHWQSGQGQRQRMGMEDKINKALSQDTVYSLYGFKGCRGDFLLSQTDTCGIIVRTAIDQDNELIWEAVIPFKAFYYKPEIDKRDKGKPLSIGFEITGLKKPEGQGGGSGTHGGGMRGGGSSFGMGMGGMRMGMGGGGHGMRGGSQNGNNNDASQQLYKSTHTWKDVGIAFQDSH